MGFFVILNVPNPIFLGLVSLGFSENPGSAAGVITYSCFLGRLLPFTESL